MSECNSIQNLSPSETISLTFPKYLWDELENTLSYSPFDDVFKLILLMLFQYRDVVNYSYSDDLD